MADDAARAIEFYTRPFGARGPFRMPGPDGRIMHGEFTIGDSPIMIADSNAETGAARMLKGSPVSIFLDVDGVDELFARAVAAGRRLGCRSPTCSGAIAMPRSSIRSA